MDLGRHEHVFFDKSLFKHVEDLTRHFRVGESIYFNAILAPKESRAKWRATQVLLSLLQSYICQMELYCTHVLYCTVMYSYFCIVLYSTSTVMDVRNRVMEFLQRIYLPHPNSLDKIVFTNFHTSIPILCTLIPTHSIFLTKPFNFFVFEIYQSFATWSKFTCINL